MNVTTKDIESLIKSGRVIDGGKVLGGTGSAGVDRVVVRERVDAVPTNDWYHSGEVILRIVVPCIGPSINEIVGMHNKQYSRLKNAFKKQVDKELQGKASLRISSHDKVKVVCVGVFGPGEVRYDAENMGITSKWVTDCIVKKKILHQDSPEFLISSELKSVRGEYRCTRYMIIKA